MHRNEIRDLEQEKVLGMMKFRRFKLSERIILVHCQCEGSLPNVRLKTSRSFMEVKEGDTHHVTLPGGGGSLGRGRVGKLVLGQVLNLAKRREVTRVALCVHDPCVFTGNRTILHTLWLLRKANLTLLHLNPFFEVSPCFTAHHPLQGLFTQWVDMKALETYRAAQRSAA